ncbi:MAG: hypothetical protein ABF491_06575 [Acetobacter sp.]|uniref:hypothetical protein n=1 Tax=Acetobacter sp. TaxID=440 RepID=UPI0039E9909C
MVTVDLRIGWTKNCPVTTLEQTCNVYKTQIDDYVTRALTLGMVPSYGMAGEV